MIVFPNCKINLGLYITAKRADGFHELQSVFIPVQLCDALEIVPTQEFSEFQYTGLPVSGKTEDNICYKAYQLLKSAYDLPPIKCHLLKNIPMGAGLGGGSSDGSFMLRLLNEVFRLNLKANELLQYAEKLGSDCAFFIENLPMYTTGRGEILEAFQPDLKGVYITIVKPDVHVSTAEAYSLIKPKAPQHDLRESLLQQRKTWRNTVMNDFEEPIATKFPVIHEIKTMLYNQGAFYASMSGSGSAVYGLFEREIDLRERFEGHYYWSGRIN